MPGRRSEHLRASARPRQRTRAETLAIAFALLTVGLTTLSLMESMPSFTASAPFSRRSPPPSMMPSQVPQTPPPYSRRWASGPASTSPASASDSSQSTRSQSPDRTNRSAPQGADGRCATARMPSTPSTRPGRHWSSRKAPDRLIRHREDRGVVAVFDNRLATAGYRRAILDSLPPFKRTVNGEEVREFLRGITGA